MLNWSLFLFLGTLGWGVSLYLIKLLIVTLSPTEIVLYRMFLGAMILWIMVKFCKIEITNLRWLLFDGFVIGLFNMALPFYLTSFAEQTVTSSLASVLNGLTPLCAFVIGLMIFNKNQSFHFIKILSLLCGLIGIMIINIHFLSLQSNMSGIFALLMTSCSYGFAANYIKTIAKTKNAILLSAMAACMSTLCMLIFKFTESKPIVWHFPTSHMQLFALFWLGTIGSGICLYLYVFLTQRMGAVKASMITYLMTLTGVILGSELLHEQFSQLTIIGSLFIIASLLLMNHGEQLQKYLRTLKVARLNS